jgi:uncharacterized UPF0160 family protein
MGTSVPRVELRFIYCVTVLKRGLGKTMTRAEEYRLYAAECLRVAQQIQNAYDKTMLLDMAQKWQALAAKAESENGRQT